MPHSLEQRRRYWQTQREEDRRKYQQLTEKKSLTLWYLLGLVVAGGILIWRFL